MMAKRFLFYTALGIGIAAIVYAVFFYTSEKPQTAKLPTQTVREPDSPHLEKSSANLYFGNKENTFLIAEKRIIGHSGGIEAFGSAIINALIEGPPQNLLRTVPSDTNLRAFYMTEDGTAYADMSKAVSEQHPGGAESELMTIYSIVNSLVLNIPEIKTVKLLIEGQESMTLAGHIDLRFPFKANRMLVR
jgi:spore germination protein GerM